ncbi:hypothetical protein Cni_G08387 [Canna indica]|uniref:PB1 domain-containing protein n=1 Tax=Canna indica TaxID=4628 RepID=A0AAQ3Q5Q4_9LILI|nr:hypothetical protein Cni_G08387 [Canna indica]
MVSGEKAKLLCSFGGDFVSQHGRPLYVGGKTRLVAMDRSASFRALILKMSELCNADPRCVDIRFQLPDGDLDFRLVSVENDEDVMNMMEEFDSNKKIPIFLFIDKSRHSDDEIVECRESALDAVVAETVREMTPIAVEEPLDVQQGPSTSPASSGRDYATPPQLGLNMSGELFRKESQSLVVGQEYPDVQTFRNALTSAAIATNFELYMVRSDQRRVTARCASEGCTWRVHASKLPQSNIFRIRTLTIEHSCTRSKDTCHRQASAKWIANCIREKLQQNRNYKPREIINDIHREYGVIITYKRAFLGRQKALEELHNEPRRHMVDNDCEHTTDSNHNENQTCGEIDNPPKKRRNYQLAMELKEVRSLHCTRCNQAGHNRRTCTVPEPIQVGVLLMADTWELGAFFMRKQLCSDKTNGFSNF